MRARIAPLASALAASRPVPRALAGLAGLAVLAAWVWPAATLDAGPVAAPAAPVRLADSGGALHRPLFDPDRRAWTARGSLADLSPATPIRSVLRVRGILMSDGSGRALIEEEGAGLPVWLAPGEGRAGWVLAAVQAERVTVRQDGRTYDLAFLGEPATLQPPRRRRAVDRAPPEAVVLAEPAPAAPSWVEPPALRLAPEAVPARVRTIPITPPRP
ncbi:hypothetical protein ASF22_04385 [Methylobacterium sp. Leaf87]|uniref:hypothetical protein n=1 Tax=Methylobacterium sp. Leaf87 TaxID=1736243 RepID=UPI0006FDF5C5|nr:hypothetical protein [Methylobacterium sp. Leaf87]KQO65916.1 hypothetical protein ASF22_04385 [Methylobacterium sp. Leaf87]